MLDFNLDENKSILYLKPSSALQADDFSRLAAVVDPYLQQHTTLKGLVIEATKFPGWENLNAFKAHMKFIKNHQSKIQKVALVTNSTFASLAENFIGPFVNPIIKHFPATDVELAKQWIEQ